MKKQSFWKIIAIAQSCILVMIVVFVAWEYPRLRGLRYHFFDRACAFGDNLGVEMLLRLGADPDGNHDYEQFTHYVAAIEPTAPLFHAARNGDTNIMSLLLAANAAPNILNGEGNLTPLAVATMGGHTAAVQLLREAGASLDLPNGRSVIELAHQYGHTNLISLLQSSK